MKSMTGSSSKSKGKAKTKATLNVSDDALTQKSKPSGQQPTFYPLFHKKVVTQKPSGTTDDEKESSLSEQPADSWNNDEVEDLEDLDEPQGATIDQSTTEGSSLPSGIDRHDQVKGYSSTTPTVSSAAKGSQNLAQAKLVSIWDLPVPVPPPQSRKRASSSKRKPNAKGAGRGGARSGPRAKPAGKLQKDISQALGVPEKTVASERLSQSKSEGSGTESRGSPAIAASEYSDSEVIHLSDDPTGTTDPPSPIVVGSSGSEVDPILLTHTPKPASKRRPPLAGSRVAPLFHGGSQENPIEVVSSPPGRSPTTGLIDLTSGFDPIITRKHDLGKQAPSTSKPVASLFATTKAAASGRSAKRRKLEPKEAVWPLEEYQHIRGEQTAFDGTGIEVCMFPPRRTAPETIADEDMSASHVFGILPSLPALADDEAAYCHQGQLTLEQRDEVLRTIPREHLQNPSIARLLSNITQHDSAGLSIGDEHEVWNDKYRPKRAEEVLGNDLHAKFLRDWLRALELRPIQNVKEQSSGKTEKGKETRGTKRPAVIRAVEKPSKKKKRRKGRSGYGDEDWIVTDDEEEEADMDEEMTDWQSGYERSSSVFNETGGALYSDMASGRATSPFKPSSSTRDVVENAQSHVPVGSTYYTFPTLTNCLLLTGPAGTGKTATVHACAEEMGWDVCELYPGIGKRTGGMMANVGEGVGSNHVIGLGTPVPGPARGKSAAKPKKQDAHGGLKGFFKAKGENDLVFSSTGAQNEVLIVEEPQPSADGSEEKVADIRQSIILIEEADILFAEDKNFWQGVISLIGESRRPVVLTCNDPNVLPIQDLPLQGTLTFEAPPGPLLASYLRVLGLLNNRVIAQDAAQELLTRSVYRPIGADLPDAPRHPLSYQEEPVVDMRKAINQLQFRCAHVDNEQEVDLQRLRTMYLGEVEEMQETLADWGEVPGEQELNDEHEDGKGVIEGLWKFMEVVSVMDSHLNRRSESSLEALSVDRYNESADDEIGYHHLPKMEYIGPGIAFYNHEEEIALESVILGREILASDGTRVGVMGGVRYDSGRLYGSRAAYQLKLASYLDEVVDGCSVPLLPRAAMVVDYVGHIERMISIEDERERVGVSERRGKRYVRQVGLSLEGLHVARDAMFPSW